MATVAAFDKSQLNNTILFVEAENVYVAQNELIRTEFHPAGNKVNFQTKGFTIAWTPSSMGYVDESGLEDMIYSVQDAPLEIKGNKARIDRSMPDVDDLFIVDGDRLKHTIIVQGWQREPVPWLSGKIDFVISGRLEFDPSLSVHSMGMKLAGPFETDEAIEIRHGDEVIFTLPKIVAFDSNIPERAEASGKYRVTANENGTLDFGIVMDNSWMADEARVYPILIDPTVIAPESYSTAGNGGRKNVVLDNNWIVSAAYDSVYTQVRLYVSRDGGQTFSQLCFIVASIQGYALVSKGNVVYVCYTYGGNSAASVTIDATKVTNTDQHSVRQMILNATETDTNGGVSAILNNSKTEIHFALSTKNSTFPNSLNIKYVRGTPGNTSITWGNPETVSTWNTSGSNLKNPCVIVRQDGYPAIICSGGSFIAIFRKVTSGWAGIEYVYNNGKYQQDYPVALVDGNGIIQVAWDGPDAEYPATRNIKYTKSTDAIGWSWEPMKKITAINYAQTFPTMGRTTANEIYILWSGIDPVVSSTRYNLRRIIASAAGVWGNPETLTKHTSSGATSRPSIMEKETNYMLGWSYQDDLQVMFDAVVFNTAPTAPTNLSPNGTSVNRAAPQRLSWKYNDSPWDTQSKFDLQWRTAGATTWNTVTQNTPREYWDAPANTFPRGNIEWQVRTYDQVGLVSPYSAQAIFFAGEKPANPTITGPSSPVPVARPTLEWSSFGQTSYQVQVLNAARAVIWDTGEVLSVNKVRTVGIDLANNTTYILRVRIKNTDDLWSDWVELTIQVSYTVPPIPTLTVIGRHAEGKISVSINNPTPKGTEPNVTSNDLYRRKAGETTWTRIKTGIPRNGSYEDYTPTSGITYEYMVRAYGDNGTFTDSTTYPGSIMLKGAWLHCVDAPASTAYQFVLRNGYSEEWRAEGSLMQFAGRKRPVAEFGESGEGNIKVDLSMLKSKDARAALQVIVQRRSTVCYRDNRGRKMFGVVFQLPSTDTHYGYEVSIQINEIDYKEDV